MRSWTDYGNLIAESVVCRGAREAPLNPVSCILPIFGSPRVISTFRPISQGQVNDIEEIQEAKPAKVTSVTTNNVPSQKRVRVIQVASRHSRLTLEVLGEECKVYPQEKQKEMPLPVHFWVLASGQFAYPEIEGCKNSKYRPHTQNVMEMRNNVVGVVQRNINSPVCLYNSSKSSNSEQYQESQSKQHRGGQPQRSSVQSCKPREDFNTSRYCNNHGCTCKICTGIYVQPYCVHVMSPHQKSKYCNRPHCVYHSYVSKHGFARKEALYVTYNTECRQNQYVYLRVTKEPEQMLIQNNVSPTCGQKERSVEVTVSQKHCQSCRKHGKTSNQQNTHKAKRPYKQGYTVKSHPLSTHICNGYLEVYRPLNTSNTRNVQTKNCLVYRSPRVTLSTAKRRIRSPPHTRPLFNQSALQQQSQSRGQHPKRDVVHSRERHIRSPDHYRYKPVSESPHKCRHYYEK